MFYLIQQDIWSEPHFETLIHNLERFGLEYEICKFETFEDHRVLHFNTKRKDVFCFGGVKLAHVANEYGFLPGSFYNENHDFEVYGPHYGDNMLNADAVVQRVDEPVPFDNYVFFARPAGDNKLFDGREFTQSAWQESLELIKKKWCYTTDTKVLFSPVKDIYQEVRCWVVNGKVITTSQYRIGRRTVYQNMDHELDIWNFTQNMVDIYQPAHAFVIDVCRTDAGMKIVELNCINCAGFYHMDSQKLLEALEDTFSQKVAVPGFDGLYENGHLYSVPGRPGAYELKHPQELNK